MAKFVAVIEIEAESMAKATLAATTAAIWIDLEGNFRPVDAPIIRQTPTKITSFNLMESNRVAR